MKTENFPTVIEAKKVVARQVAYYRLMMQDEEVQAAKANAAKGKTSQKKPVATGRKRNKAATVAA